MKLWSLFLKGSSGILCAILVPTISEGCGVLECIQRRATELVKGLEGMSCEEWLRSLDLSSLQKRKLWGDLIAFHSFLRRGSGKGDAGLFSEIQ